MPGRAIIHIDMDAFYASVEQRDDTKLKGKPVIVGGHPTRGVVLAASYEVRPFGVRSAMPMSRALKMAPQAIVVTPRPQAYAEASDAVFKIFESVTPLVEPLSLDEAFLDVSASQSLFGTPSAIAQQLRKRIADEVGLPASAGIADVKFVAKVASDFAKPNGQKEVLPGTSAEFLKPLPVSRLWGVGPKLEAQLTMLGVKTIGDVAGHSIEWLTMKLGSVGQHLHELSRAIDDRPVVPDRQAKSIGAQDTFEEDVVGLEALKPQLHSQAWRVGRRLRRVELEARCVQVTIKYSDFSLLTRRHTLPQPTSDGQLIYREAVKLLEKVDCERGVRLTGVSAQELTAGESQLGLFGPAAPSKTKALNAALDSIASRFGSAAIAPADIADNAEDDERDAMRRQMGASKNDVKPRKP